MKISTQVSLYIILVLLVVICVLYDENKRESDVVHTHYGYNDYGAIII